MGKKPGSAGDNKKKAIGGMQWGPPLCGYCKAETRLLHHQWHICKNGHRQVKKRG